LDIEIGGAKVVNIKGQLRSDILNVAMCAIDKAKPDAAVKHALGGIQIEGNIYLVAVGKAAWQMADAAVRYLDRPIEKGIVLTKYGHISGEIPGIICLRFTY
jgi:hydroxypyruvate reductase